MDLRTAKIIALFGQVVVLLVFTLLPIKVIRGIERLGAKGELIISCFRCFGGGALVGSFLLHQIPEIRHLLQRPLLDANGIKYPLPELIAGLGFFLFLFIERFVHVYQHRAEKREREEAVQRHVTSRFRADSFHVNPALDVSDDSFSVNIDKPPPVDSNHNNRFHGDTLPSNGLPTCASDLSTKVIITRDLPPEKTLRPSVSASSFATTASGDDVMDIDYEALEVKPSATRSIILLIALGADGVFQGLAVGLKISQQSVWNIFTAIVSHEFVMAFCLGMELVRSSSSTVRGVVIPAIVYALTPALGTAIGIALYEAQGDEHSGDSITLANGILQSIATGVFLYVAFIGILAEEQTVNPRVIKIVMVFVGFALMSGLAAIENLGDAPGHTTSSSNVSSIGEVQIVTTHEHAVM